MIFQQEIALRPHNRGVHLVTGEVLNALPDLPKHGLMHLLIKHTSAALALNENADPDVRHDLAAIFDRLVPENAPYYTHTYEGADDIPAHAKSIIVGSSLTLPITHGKLNLGTWQGLYLCEFRDNGGQRKVVVTIIGDNQQ
ncbi:MAG: YjbQ family protein [Muribaculaceae bacterium]|nr:YjbQ family protein [Muribaculaceae bacterium]